MAPLIKRPAPAFEATAVIDGQFREVSNQEFLGKWCAAPSFCGVPKRRAGANKFHRVILLFYPLDFTFVVRTFRASAANFLLITFLWRCRSAVPHRARSIC